MVNKILELKRGGIDFVWRQDVIVRAPSEQDAVCLTTGDHRVTERSSGLSTFPGITGVGGLVTRFQSTLPSLGVIDVRERHAVHYMGPAVKRCALGPEQR